MAKRSEEGTSMPLSDYVGYGHPPKEHQFRKGQKANPWGCKGRPKPKADFLDERHRIRVDGRSRWVTRDEALDHALYKMALAGNVSAVQQLEQRQKRRLAAKGERPEAEKLSPDEKAAMLHLLERNLRPTPDDADGNGGRP
ncbi:hypothetical protein JNW90_23530 [Micromonospora sp. STR1s_5]|nr:hypothetical protein [Micromonospora sp. STR1s_5]